MLDLESVRLLFRNRLMTMTGYPGDAFLKVENRSFVPPSVEDQQVWITEVVTISSEIQSSNGLNEVNGIARYDVSYPIGKGTEVPGALSLLIANRFNPAQGLAGSPHSVNLYRTFRGTSEGDDLWYTVPVNVWWRSHVASTP